MEPENGEGQERPGRLRSDRRTWAIAVLVVIALVGGVLIVRSRSSVDQATAIQIASDFAFKSQPAGTQIRGIHETSVSEIGNAWQIDVSFDALAAGDASANPEPHHLLIDVDKGSGTPSLVGQG